MKDRTVGFLGAGNMAEALIRGLLASEALPAAKLWACDVRAERLRELHQSHGIHTTTDAAAMLRSCDVVVLSVKPQTLAQVLPAVAEQARPGALVISVAAGVTIDTIEGQLVGRRLIRAMPNAPALAQAGATALARGRHASDDDERVARWMFEAVGRVVVVEEKQMDAVTGLSGSGPAYLMLVIEALADGGVKMGLPRETALMLATQTTLGSARLLQQTRLHPGALKDMVASPGGTTIAGLHRLEAGALRATLMDAVEAATRRSEELGARMNHRQEG
jgi:pyrroline-5-carboxylate reductase